MGFLRGIGPLEIFLILVVVLIVFGVGKLPSAGKGMGQALREFRNSVKDEDEKAIEAPIEAPEVKTEAENKVS